MGKQVENGLCVPEEVRKKLEEKTHLTAMMALPMQPLMLKKQPEIVETLRCLRKYVGPSDQSGYSAAERAEIGRGVKQVRERANTLLTRLYSLFPNYSTTTGDFSEYFQEEVSQLKEATKEWTEEKVLSMTVDPLAIEA